MKSVKRWIYDLRIRSLNAEIRRAVADQVAAEDDGHIGAAGAIADWVAQCRAEVVRLETRRDAATNPQPKEAK